MEPPLKGAGHRPALTRAPRPSVRLGRGRANGLRLRGGVGTHPGGVLLGRSFHLCAYRRHAVSSARGAARRGCNGAWPSSAAEPRWLQAVTATSRDSLTCVSWKDSCSPVPVSPDRREGGCVFPRTSVHGAPGRSPRPPVDGIPVFLVLEGGARLLLAPLRWQRGAGCPWTGKWNFPRCTAWRPRRASCRLHFRSVCTTVAPVGGLGVILRPRAGRWLHAGLREPAALYARWCHNAGPSVSPAPLSSDPRRRACFQDLHGRELLAEATPEERASAWRPPRTDTHSDGPRGRLGEELLGQPALCPVRRCEADTALAP